MTVKYFLLIDGLNGGSTDEQHLGWFEIDDFNFNINPPPAGGEATFQPLTVFLSLSDGLAGVLKDAALGTSIQSIRIEGVTVGPTPIAVYDLTLGNVQITSADAGSGSFDSLTFAYKQVSLTTKTADGLPAESFSYDVEAGHLDASIPTPTVGTSTGDVATPAKYFLLIDGLNGGSTDEQHLGWFEIDDFNFNISPPPAGGAATFQPVSVFLSLSDGLAGLLKDAALGTSVQSVRIEGVTAGATPIAVYDLTLGNVQITSAGAGSGPFDILTFAYKQVALTTKTANGLPAESFSYDVEAGHLDASTPIPTVGASTGDVAAPAKYFLLIDGLNGGSTDEQHLGWFEIDGFNLNITPPPAGGAATFQPVSVFLSLSDGLAGLLKDAALGTRVQSVRIEGVTAGATPIAVYDLTLGNVQITSAQGGSGPFGSLTFAYEQVALTTKTANGLPAESFSYDVAAGHLDASIPTPTVGASTGDVAAPAKFFLLIDGLNGGSTDEQHLGWFEIDWVDFNISSPPAGGAATFKPVIVQLSLSDGLAGLLKDAALGTSVQSVRIEGVTAGATPIAVYDLTLGNVQITSADAGSGPFDILTFAYKQVALTTKTANGLPAESFSYDVEAGHLDASTPIPTVGASTGDVAAPAKYFLLIDGLNGGSTDEQHLGWFEIDGFNLNINPPPAGGAATFQPVSVFLSLSDGLAGLLKDAALGTRVQSVRIEGVTAGATPIAVYDLTLGNVQITRAQGGSGSFDSLTFAYKQVSLTTKTADGLPAESFSYDVAAGHADASIPTPTVGASIGDVLTPAKYFLLIDGLNGGSTDEHHVGWFEIDGFNLNINPPPAGGAATFQPVTVFLSLSDGLTGVLKDAALGTSVQSVRIEGVTAGPTPIAVYDLTLGNVQITRAHDSSGAFDSLTLDYTQLGLITYVQQANGSIVPGASFGYDVARNRIIEPGTLPPPNPAGVPPVAAADGPYHATEDTTLIVNADEGVLANDPSSTTGGLPANTAAASKYFLLIDGLNGGSTDEQHLGWFEIDDFNFNINPPPAGGEATFQPLTVFLSLSDGLAGVLKDAARGTSIQSIRIEGVTVGPTPIAVYDLTLGNVQITSADAGSGSFDSLTFAYKQVSLTTKTADGLPAESFSYDVAAGHLDASIPTPTVGTSTGDVATPAKYFLLIDGLNGGSTDEQHLGWFEIDDFNFNISPPPAGGAATFQPVSVFLSLSDGLAGLLKDAALGTSVQSVRIEGVTAGATPIAVYDLTLGNVQITSAGAGSGPFDILTFAYKQVALTTKTANGLPAESFSYDVEAGHLDASTPIPTVGASTGDVAAPAKYFLLIDGLNGGSTDEQHLGWFEIDGFNLNITPPPAGGAATFQPVSVFLSLSDGLAGLLKDAALGTRVQSVRIEGVTAGATPIAVYDLTLGNVQITSAQGGSGPFGSLTFAYEQVALTTKTANGLPAESFSYDVAAGHLDASIPTPTVGASTGDVAAPAKFFLLIDGLNGGSTDEQHLGWFEIDWVDFNISSPPAGGAATFKPVIVQLSLSDGLAGLLKDAALGTSVQSVRIEGVTAGATPIAVYDLTLGNVQITSADAGSGPFDILTFAYKQVALTTKTANGLPAESFSYDVEAGHLDASTPIPTVGASTGDVAAPAKYFLLIDGLNGGSTDEQHLGWFEIDGFNLNINPPPAGGAATFQPVSVFLSLSDGLAGLLKDAALGTSVQSVRIEGVTAAATPVAVYDLTLGNVQITSARAGSGSFDSLTFAYEQVSLTTKTADGLLAERFSYDVAAGHADASIPTPTVGASIGDVLTPAKYFLLIDGLNGGSTDEHHVGWFEIDGFDFRITPPPAGGTATFQPVLVQLSLSDGITGVLKDAALGTSVQSVRIEGVTAGPTPIAVYDLTLGNVQITRAHDSSGAFDSLTLDYTQLGLITYVQQANGSIVPGASFGYDVARNRIIEPGTLPPPSPNGGDGSELTAELVSTTSHGTLTLNPDGSFVYTPNDNFNGTDSFVYHANDGSKNSNDVTVLINVAPVNDAPVITSVVNIVVAENRVAVETVTAVDPEQDAFLLGLAAGSDQTFFSIDPHTGALSFVNSPDFETPEDANHDNIYDVAVSATDAFGASSTQTIHVTVTDVLEVGQTIQGGSGNDTITGTPGNDTIGGGKGNDSINGGDGKDSLSGGDGNDALTGGRGDDVLDGGNGDDTLDGGVGNNQLSGGSGNDFLRVGDGNNALNGGSGNDVLIAGNGSNVLVGGDGNDALTGGRGDDVLDGGNGDDTLDGGVGNNQLSGGSGNDFLRVGDGNNALNGGSGNDVLIAGNGSNVLVGGDGNDALTGGRGDDVLDGGNGDDTLDGGVGNNQLSGGSGNDFLRVGDGNNALNGGSGNDVLIAGNGSNVLVGGDGNDTLTAGNGSNNFTGGDGDDTFRVGAGNNTFTGGKGNDTFVFGPSFGKEIITDFGRGDHIKFEGGVFANFLAVQGAMHQVGADTVISLGADHLITLLGVSASSLHASDFLLIA